MARELLQARFDPDTVEQIQEYADEMDISRSEALRRAVREGVLTLARDTDDDATDDATGQLYTARQSGTLVMAAAIGASVLSTMLTLTVLGVI